MIKTFKLMHIGFKMLCNFVESLFAVLALKNIYLLFNFFELFRLKIIEKHCFVLKQYKYNNTIENMVLLLAI